MPGPCAMYLGCSKGEIFVTNSDLVRLQLLFEKTWVTGVTGLKTGIFEKTGHLSDISLILSITGSCL